MLQTPDAQRGWGRNIGKEPSVFGALTKRFRQTPDAHGLGTPEGTWANYWSLADQLAQARHAAAKAFPSGARIATLLPDDPISAVLILALVDEVSVFPLNPATPAPEIARLIKTSGTSALVAHDAFSKTVAEMPPIGVPVTYAAGIVGAANVSLVQDHTPGLLLLTTGSTGTPKRVPVSSHAMMHSARAIIDALDLTSQDAPSMPCHCSTSGRL